MELASTPVLVTGATGLIGSALALRLASEGALVRTTHLSRDPLVSHPRIEHVRGDLAEAPFCRRAVEGVEIVFHCAARTSGAAAMAATPMVHVIENVVINARLLEAAYERGVRKFVWLSSTTRYPPSGDRPVREEEMFEGEPFEKYYFVGWMKRFTEVLCRMYGEKLPKRMTTIVLRPTNVYGPRDRFDFATSHVLPALVRKVVERMSPIEVWGTGDDVRDLVYVDDVIDAMVRAARMLDTHAALNIGMGRGCSVRDLLDLICKVDGYENPRVAFNASKPTMIPIRLVDVERARRLLGWTARIGLEEGLQSTIAWYRANRAA